MDAANCSASDERELVITRIFDAPRALVYRAWTDPLQSAQWMGPRGFTACCQAFDFRPGGTWRTCLRPDDGGQDLWQGGTYHEIVEPERLVFTFAWDGDDGHSKNEMLVSVRFEEHQGRTKMTLRQTAFLSADQRDGHQGGWNSTFDRLEDYLAKA